MYKKVLGMICMSTMLVGAGVMYTLAAQTMVNAEMQETASEADVVQDEVAEESEELEEAVSEEVVATEEQPSTNESKNDEATVLAETKTPTIATLFPDKVLAKIIAKDLKNKKLDEPLTQTELDSITSLKANGGKAIERLEGLQHLNNLKTLEFQKQKISDLRPLEKLVNLERIVLTMNQITDIEPLQYLMKLQHLTLDMNKITDIKPLRNLANITELGLRHNRVSDLGVLTNLQKMTRLGLDGNKIDDVRPLNGLIALVQLTLEGNTIRDIGPLTNLLNLRVLNLSKNMLTNVSQISNLRNLQKIALGKSRGSETENTITDFSFLGSLTQLEDLDIEGQDITRLPAGVLTRIKVLNARAGRLTDLTPFLELTNLTTLLLADNEFEDLTPLARAVLPNLRELDLAANYISDLSPFATAKLPALEKLSLNNQQNKETLLIPHAAEIIVQNNVKDNQGNFMQPKNIFPVGDDFSKNEGARIIFTIPMPNGQTRIGYKWSEEIEVGTVMALFSGTRNVDVYEHYFVNFIVGDTVHAAIDARPETYIEAPTDPVQRGYEFIGWFTEAIGGNRWDFATNATPAETLNLYAQFRGVKHNLTYNNDGELTQLEVRFGEQLNEPVVPPKVGYTFAGWFTEPTGGELWNFAAWTMPDRDLVLYAQYTQNVYTVTFLDGQDVFATLNVNYGELVRELDTVPTRTGQTFVGWFKSETSEQFWNFEEDVMPADNIILYARWQPTERKLTTRGKDIEINKTEFLNIIERRELEAELLDRSGVQVIDEYEEIIFHIGNADFIVSNLTDLIEVLGEGEYVVHLAYVDKNLAGDTSLSTEVKLTVLADAPTNPGGGSNTGTGGGDRLVQTGERTKEQLFFSGLMMMNSLILLFVAYIYRRRTRKEEIIDDLNL